MKKQLLPIVMLVTMTIAHSQSFQWVKNGGGNNTLTTGISYAQKESIIDLTTDTDRNSYAISIIGKTNSTIAGNSITVYDLGGANGNQDAVLTSLSCDGSYRWHKVFGGGGYDILSGVTLDSQNNIYVTGMINECELPSASYYSTARIGDNNGVDYTFANSPTACQRTFIAKFSNTGVFQWIHFPYAPVSDIMPYADPQNLRNLYMVNDVLHWLVWLPAGTYENGALVTTTPGYYLLKYNATGGLVGGTLFDLQITGRSYNGFPSKELRWFRNPYNGYFYVLFNNSSSNNISLTAGGNTLNNALAKVFCFNEQGQYQWNREASANQIFTIEGLAFDEQNKVYVSGLASPNFPTTFLGWSSSSINGTMGNGAYIIKSNADLTTNEWATAYNAGATQVGYSIYYSNNVVYFAGKVNNDPFTWGSQSITGPGSNNSADPLLARFNPSTGACIGLHRLPGTNGYEDSFTAITQDTAGDIILGGYMGLDLVGTQNTATTYGGNTDFFVTKFATQACQPLSNQENNLPQTILYPNPTTGLVTLQNLTQNTSYKLSNLLGQTIQTGTLTPNQNTLSLENLPQGNYNLLLTQNGAVVYKTLIIKK